MRFSLLSLFALLTGICVALGIYSEHGAFGLWFLVPHLLLIGWVAWLRRKNWKRTGWISVATYVAAWAGTWTIGLPDLEVDVGERVTATRWSYAHDFGPHRRVDYDPFVDPTKPRISPPWYFVGNGSSPCPLVASIQYGHSVGGAGGGGKLYALWIGRWHSIGYQFYWCQ